MSDSVIDSPPFHRLLIVRLSAMGDIIHTLPAVVALRRALPHVNIGWLVEERWAELLCTLRYPRSGPRSPQRPLIDRLHTVNTAVWRRSPFSFNTWQQMATDLSDLHGMDYDAAIDFQGAVRSAVLARCSGANVIFGEAQPRENAASMWYSRQVQVAGAHVIERALSLARAATKSALRMADAEFPDDPDAEASVDKMLGDLSSFAILNPGAGWGAKQWPPERFGQVARGLANLGLCCLVNYGPGEAELATIVERASEGAARKVSCTISTLIALTRRARLFIGGDTGPMHLAAALKVPVVAIFGPTSPERNGPYRTRSIVLRSAVSETSHSRRVTPEKGLLEITPAEVVCAARKLLSESAP